MLTFVATVATVSALVAGALPAIQIAKLWRNRSAEGISTVWVIGALTNSVVWNVYALLLGNMTLILPNALSLAMNVSMTVVVFAVRHPKLATGAKQALAHPIAHFAKAVVEDPELAAEFAALVEVHESERFAAADTLILRPGDLRLSPA
jgi:uncharacterized protein with PQ loop repeat